MMGEIPVRIKKLFVNLN